MADENMGPDLKSAFDALRRVKLTATAESVRKALTKAEAKLDPEKATMVREALVSSLAEWQEHNDDLALAREVIATVRAFVLLA